MSAMSGRGVSVTCAAPVNRTHPSGGGSTPGGVRNNARVSSSDRFRPPSGRPLGPTLLVLVAWLLAIGAVEVAVGWLITHPLKSTMTDENSINRWFVHQRTSTLTDVADVGTLIGETVTGLVALALIALVFAVWQRSLWPALFVLALDGGIGLFYLASTTLDPRNRPPVRILQSGLVADHSFPSGHTGTATAIAGALAALLWVYTTLTRAVVGVLGVVPVWTMLARLYEGAHHLSDVLTALVVTLVWLTVCARLLLPARDGRPG
jgi:membrane-associated phospholipid phosphatase